MIIVFNHVLFYQVYKLAITDDIILRSQICDIYCEKITQSDAFKVTIKGFKIST